MKYLLFFLENVFLCLQISFENPRQPWFLVQYKVKICVIRKISSILKYSHSVQDCGYGNNIHHSNMLL